MKPEIETCTLVGTGLAARALGPALTEIGVRIVHIGGRDLTRTAALAHALGATTHSIATVPVDADLMVICVPESAISAVTELVFSGKRVTGTIVAHMAGSQGLDALVSAQTAGANVAKLHPIASLSGGPSRLRGVAWGIEATPETQRMLRHLVERLDGIPFDLGHVNLPLYHLAAVFASNYLLALIDASTQLWTMSGAPAPPAEALLPLIRGTLQNWAEMGIEEAITGPISRGDGQAVERQLRTIREQAGSLEGLYRDLALATLEIVERRVGGPDARVAEIGRILSATTVLD